METTSRSWAKFKRTFVGPKITRKQRLAIAPGMPAEKLTTIKKQVELINLTPDQIKKAEWSAYIVERRKKRDRSLPGWADKKAIKQFYVDAKQLTITTGIKHEVDHIIPSNHPLVCGLHVEYNLQILTKSENTSKGNSFEIATAIDSN
jgi:hypothetical protein